MPRCVLLADMVSLRWQTSETGKSMTTQRRPFLSIRPHGEAFEILLARIDAGRPKQILADEPQRPVLVFTDGAVKREQMARWRPPLVE